MRTAIDALVQVAAWIAVVMAALVSVSWAMVVADGDANGIYAPSVFGFTLVAVVVAVGILFLGVGPNVSFYLDRRRRRDLLGFVLASLSLVVVVVEVIILNLMHQRGG